MLSGPPSTRMVLGTALRGPYRRWPDVYPSSRITLISAVLLRLDHEAYFLTLFVKKKGPIALILSKAPTPAFHESLCL